MNKYVTTRLDGGAWVVTEQGHDYLRPSKACTFAFDTETQTYYKNRLIQPKNLLKKTKGLTQEQKRQRLSTITWAWQCYDEVNGFFMTNDFYEWLTYQCRCGYMFGWCYNATFDFSQIDYEVLAKGRDKWKQHSHDGKREGKAYNKAQAWTYESLHNDMGARYAYKLWVEYRHYDRHKYVHAVEYRDFMKLITGGLKKLLEDLDIRDNNGEPIRKLTMEYQAVDTDNLTEQEIDYCNNDVKGLYFAVKKFNVTIEEISDGESHIYGKYTNVMTAGGLAKSELLRSLYPNKAQKRFRLEAYHRQHPLSAKQDKYLRDNHLYRGGVSFVNPRYKGKLLTAQQMGRPMYRYDVNSEYPYSMAEICDLVGAPFRKKFAEWLEMPKAEREKYECIYILKGITGSVKNGFLGLWYDPFKRSFVDEIDESETHLIFEREYNEMLEWYDDVEIDIDEVILCKRGGHNYRPFVEKNYRLKAEAKKAKNKTLQQVAKLLLNSSYGKLSERLERVNGHYELNEATGAIHFVVDGTETQESGAMSVLVGALVTSFARCYILGKIREICKRPADTFVYIDTDSIHAFAEYDKADAFALGGLKLEAVCEAVKYVLPKTYVDIEKVNADGSVDLEGVEVHSKGVNLSAIITDLKKKQKGIKHGLPTLDLIDRKIAYGSKFVCLQAMNVKGGKCLIPTEKYLARLEQAPSDDEKLVYTNVNGAIFTEI